MATSQGKPEIVRIAVNALYGQLPRPDFERLRKSSGLSKSDCKLMYGEKTLSTTSTPAELGMTGKVHISLERLGDCSHYHRSPDLEKNCPWCCEEYSNKPGHAPVQTACGHWICLGCFETHVRSVPSKGVRCLLHPDRFVSVAREEGPVADWLKEEMDFLSPVVEKCQVAGCEKDAVRRCPDCEGMGSGAQCEEHCKQLHSILTNHTPVALEKTPMTVGGSGICHRHRRALVVGLESKAEEGSATYKMCCPECLSPEEATGMKLDTLAEQLKPSLDAFSEADFSAKYQSGICRCLELESRFKEFVGDGDKLGSIDAALKKIRRFYAGLKAKLDENCRAMEAQVAEEAEKRIAVPQKLHSQSVETVSRVQHAMAVYRAVAAVKDAAPHALVWCHNRVSEAEQGEYPLLKEAPPSAIEVSLPESTAEAAAAECIGEVLPPRPSAPADLAVNVSDYAVVDARWTSQSPAGTEEFEVVLDGPEEVSLYRGANARWRCDLGTLKTELKEDCEYGVRVRSISDGGRVSGTSDWSDTASFRIPAGALFPHPVMVAIGNESYVEGFDLLTRRWRDLTPLPKDGRFNTFSGCAFNGDDLYVAQYRQRCGFCKTVWKSSSRRCLKWSSASPFLKCHFVAPLINRQDGSLWVLGGSSSSTVERYWPSERKWKRGPPMTVCEGEGLSAVELPDGRLVALGGGGTNMEKSEILDGRTWIALPDAPGKIAYCASGVVAGRVVVAGGHFLKEMALALDVRERKWSNISPLTAPQSSRASVVWNEELYLAGSSMLVYDPRADAWRQEEAALKHVNNGVFSHACLGRLKMPLRESPEPPRKKIRFLSF